MAGVLGLLLLAVVLLMMAPASQAQYVPSVRVLPRSRSIGLYCLACASCVELYSCIIP